MKVGDLVRWYNRLFIIVGEGPEAMVGTMWNISAPFGCIFHISPVFENDLELINESK